MSNLSEKTKYLLAKYPDLDLNAMVDKVISLRRAVFSDDDNVDQYVIQLCGLLKLKMGIADARRESTDSHLEDFERIIAILDGVEGDEVDPKALTEPQFNSVEALIQGELLGENAEYFPRVPDLRSGAIRPAPSSSMYRFSRSSGVWGKKVTKEIINESPDSRRRARKLSRALNRKTDTGEPDRPVK